MVKANYVRLGQPGGGRAAVKASAHYYGHRPDEDGRRGYRPGFDAERDALGKEEIRERVEGAKGDYAYRIVLSPGREMDAGEVREWAREAMGPLEREGGEWFGFVHDDHTGHPHAHVLAFAGSKLEREDLAEIRREGDRAAQEMLEGRAELERDPMEQELGKEPAEERSAEATAPKERHHERELG